MRHALGFVFLLAVMVLATTLTTWAEAPEQSGPFVYRYEDFLGVAFSNRYDAVTVAINWDLFSYCSGSGPIPPDPTLADHMLVLDPQHPDDAILHSTMDNAMAWVWPYTAGAGTVCDQVLAAGIPLASGVVDMVAHNNDVSHDPEETWVYGFMAHGRMTSSDGEPVLFMGQIQCRHNPGYPVPYCTGKVHVTP